MVSPDLGGNPAAAVTLSLFGVRAPTAPHPPGRPRTRCSCFPLLHCTGPLPSDMPQLAPGSGLYLWGPSPRAGQLVTASPPPTRPQLHCTHPPATWVLSDRPAPAPDSASGDHHHAIALHFRRRLTRRRPPGLGHRPHFSHGSPAQPEY
ncbi:hypothetical protein NDU88_007592 [Pleurodeles waltl]|uniref:Uncharacterized protein n=1 Tax=Pleurodeles waltl TaxID=8319 RepID=A0AAV7RUJ3_PLEWA|nr:hypothetical protein NDU88_007592 [Pleurodeles waltl]